MSRKKGLRELQPIAKALGYRLEGTTTRGHIKWRGANGKLVITGSSLNQACSLANAIKQLRLSRKDDRQ